MSQEVLIIQPQLFEAGPRHVGQLEFHLFGGAAGLAALGDILDAAARRLDHLVVGPAAPIDVAITETDRHVIAELGHLKALQFPVPAMRRDEIPRRIFLPETPFHHGWEG
jgi:hypothetical protein